MKDDHSCQVRLCRYSTQDNVTYYHFQLKYHSELYTTSYRYSKLRTLAMMLPQTKTQFPAPQHLEKIVASITGSETFLKQRFEKLNNYFNSVNQCGQLEQNPGFLRMLEDSKKLESQPQDQEQVPKAPHLLGKKLSPKLCHLKYVVTIC